LSKQEVHRLPALARRITGASRERVTFNDSTGEVRDAMCRRTARLDHARTSAIAAGLGYRS